jgi:hypothetical protein
MGEVLALRGVVGEFGSGEMGSGERDGGGRKGKGSRRGRGWYSGSSSMINSLLVALDNDFFGE